MTKESVFTIKLETDLRTDFLAETDALHRPASQVVRELMRDFVDRQRKKREYEAFLHGKVDRARVSMRADHGFGAAEFAARRDRLTDPA